MRALPPMTVLAARVAKPASSVRRCRSQGSWLIIGWPATTTLALYFGRCDTAHSLACSIGARGGSAARGFLTVGNPSIFSRQREKPGYLGYMALASGAKPNE